MTTKELREKRAQLIAESRTLNDKVLGEKRDMTPEENEQWTRMNADIDSLGNQIERMERLDKLESEMAAPVPGRSNFDGHREREQERTSEQATKEDRALALQAWCRVRKGMDVDESHVAAARRVGINLNSTELTLRLAKDAPKTQREARALSAVDGSAGGYLVFPEFVGSLERALLAFGGIRNAAQVIRTSGGENMQWPTTDDTSNTGELIGENKVVSEQDVTIGATLWGAYKFSSKMVKVPSELLQDSAFNLVDLLGSMLGERIGRITNTYFTTGSGAAQPWGIVNRATTGKTTASATAITFDEVMDLVYSVDSSYRTGAKFMFNEAITLALRKLKDGEARYLWQQAVVDGEPDRLFTYPIVPNSEMASSIAASAITMLFGQLDAYKIRDVGEFRLFRLVERYRDYDQDGFVAFSRHDGNLLDAGTHPVKRMVQAAA